MLVHSQEQHSAGFTTQVCSPEIVTETDTETDIDKLIIVLDYRSGYWNDFDSAEFVLFNHSQRILVVTTD